MIKKGLGKGLGALFSVYDEAAEETKTIEAYEEKTKAVNVGTNEGALEIALANIKQNPNQPRKNFDVDALEELAESIKVHGVIQPIIVTKTTGEDYIIIAGERRYRAAKIAGLTSIPAIVKKYTDRQIKEIALIENMQREDLNPIETAKGLKQVMVEYKMTQDELAERIGKSRSAIANTLRLLTLEPEVVMLVEQGSLSAGHARALVALTDAPKQIMLARMASGEKMSVREVEQKVKDLLTPSAPKKRLVREQSMELRELVEEMQRAFATKVSVVGNDNKGRFSIDYFSKDDLDRICEIVEYIKAKK